MQSLTDNGPVPDFPALTNVELTKALIKHYDVHEGKYELLVEFQLGVGSIGPDPESRLPSGVVGLSKVGLKKASVDNKLVVDAAVVNPVPKAKPVVGKK